MCHFLLDLHHHVALGPVPQMMYRYAVDILFYVAFSLHGGCLFLLWGTVFDSHQRYGMWLELVALATSSSPIRP